MKYCLFILFALFYKTSASAKDKKFTILFDLGDHNISSKSKAYIDSLLYYDVIRPGQKFAVVGYADYLGDSSMNMVLSEKRANTVKDYLVNMGFNKTDLETVQWKGEMAEADASSDKGGTAG